VHKILPVVKPVVHLELRIVPRRQERVGNNEACKAGGVACHHSQPQKAAPILKHCRNVFEVEVVDQKIFIPHHVPVVRVVALADWLVALPKPDLIEQHYAVSLIQQRRDEVAVEVAPARLAVREQHSLSLACS